MQCIKSQKGYSILELLIIFGILAGLLGIVTINLLGATNRTYESTTGATLSADLKGQQVKAMNGDTESSRINNAYGVYFETTRYTLFRGSSYNNSDPSNFTVTLASGTTFTNILFPNFQVVFASGSGEFANFSANHNSLKINNVSDNSLKTFTINRFGAITIN